MITSDNAVAPELPSKAAKSLTRLRLHPALRDLVVTGMSSVFVAVAAMVVISILGKTAGPVLLGEYLLVRRMASWIQAGVQIPSGVALPRYVAFAIDQSTLTRQTYFLAALLTSWTITIVLGVILMLWRDPLSHLFFGTSQLDHLVFPLCLFLLGLAVNGVVFGYYQGTLEMVRASVLQTCNLAIVPVLVTLLLSSRSSIPLIVNSMGIGMCAGACFFAWPIIRRWELGIAPIDLRRQGSELLSYGFARVFGDIGLQAMLSLPAVVAAHYFSIGSVSFLLLGGSFVTLVGAASLPLANILLSRVSRCIAQMRTDDLELRVTYFVCALIELAAFVCPQMIVFADVIVRNWVGAQFLGGIAIIRITILAVPFYLVYAGLRGVIDAAAVRAYNTRNIVTSGGIFLLSVVLIKLFVPLDLLLEGLAASGVIGLAILALCTLRTLRHLVHTSFEWLQILPGVAVAAVLGTLSVFFHKWTSSELGLTTLLLYQLVVGGLYLLILWAIRSSWVRFLLNSMLVPMEVRDGTAANS